MRGFPLENEEHVETLLSAAEGETLHETSLRWRCSVRAVAKRRQAVVAHLGARNMIHAVALAYERGLLHAHRHDKMKGP